jgi:hypothetical protein
MAKSWHFATGVDTLFATKKLRSIVEATDES